jgi:cytochrome c556
MRITLLARRLPAWLAVASGVCLAVNSTAGPDADTAAVMRTKLRAAQDALAAIAVADFPKVQTNAATLVALSGQRGWAARQTTDYELFTTGFRLAAESLGKAAKARDIDGAASAYAELTQSCVACHKYLRDPQPRPKANP